MSKKVQTGLVGSRIGRVILHVLALYRDGKYGWHWRGIAREMLLV